MLWVGRCNGRQPSNSPPVKMIIRQERGPGGWALRLARQAADKGSKSDILSFEHVTMEIFTIHSIEQVAPPLPCQFKTPQPCS